MREWEILFAFVVALDVYLLWKSITTWQRLKCKNVWQIFTLSLTKPSNQLFVHNVVQPNVKGSGTSISNGIIMCFFLIWCSPAINSTNVGCILLMLHKKNGTSSISTHTNAGTGFFFLPELNPDCCRRRWKCKNMWHWDTEMGVWVQSPWNQVRLVHL